MGDAGLGFITANQKEAPMPETSSIPNTTNDEQAPGDQVAKKRRANPVTISMPPAKCAAPPAAA